MIIAIDGPAGSGKSTVARRVARELGFLYVDTGAMYRALTWKALKEKIDLCDSQELVALAGRTRIALVSPGGRKQEIKVLVNGKNVTGLIRKPAITNSVSYLANLSGVRKRLVAEQRKFARQGDVTMEGRDIGTVVFPRAEKKFFLDAQFEERVRRRYQERCREGNDKVAYDTVRRDLRDRDRKDRTRKHGPLRVAQDAIYIDTTSCGIREVVDRITDEVRRD